MRPPAEPRLWFLAMRATARSGRCYIGRDVRLNYRYPHARPRRLKQHARRGRSILKSGANRGRVCSRHTHTHTHTDQQQQQQPWRLCIRDSARTLDCIRTSSPLRSVSGHLTYVVGIAYVPPPVAVVDRRPFGRRCMGRLMKSRP